MATYRYYKIFCTSYAVGHSRWFVLFPHNVIAGSSQRDPRSSSLAIPLQALRCGPLVPRVISKVHAANLHGEFAAWFAAQALYCASRRVAAVSVFPEGCWWSLDGGTYLFGEHCASSGNFGGKNDAHRGAGYFLQLGDADQMRSIDVLTNFASLLPMNWPILQEVNFELRYGACTEQHKTMRGTHLDGGVNSSLSLGLLLRFLEPLYGRHSADKLLWGWEVSLGRSLCPLCVYLRVRTLWQVLLCP